ncbi:MAG: DMT family transporter [Alphaproteobacteria bacterium]|nr:DMT family transporter [Alphaproteobacteria bacterium]MDP6567490.1 DMT family transporter [Alphaproteobacteria bacterium]
MNTRAGVAIGIASCCLGAGAAVATRFLVTASDPVTLVAIRFGGGFLCVLPVALVLGATWPRRSDLPVVAGLGFLFYGVFFILYNVALQFTTVARGTLAISTLPLMTMAMAAVLGMEALSARKTTGVLVAVLGVAVALTTGLASAPIGAWRGDLIMALATLCMALYSIYSRPYAARSSPLGVLTAGMAAGGLAMILASMVSGGFWRIGQFGAMELLAAAYLAVGGGALAFVLWIHALQLASPTQVTNTMTVNPLVASLLAAAFLGEPITIHLAIGLAAVFAGILIATTGPLTAETGGRTTWTD